MQSLPIDINYVAKGLREATGGNQATGGNLVGSINLNARSVSQLERASRPPLNAQR